MARVVLNDIYVDFPIYDAREFSLRETIYRRATGGLIQRDAVNNGRVLVRALNGVSLELQQGDRLGLVGHNGAGKSTLLKAIAGIYEPVRGSILVEGRVTPLFDMMPGLDPEDTGYENIFTSGLLLGMERNYIESKIPEIEEFCELGEYLSLPVRTYSAGMTTRLGFALVTALDPDVLLMDEGLGAADLRFTERSAERMDEFIGRSRIMVLASHSDSMISSICNKAAWLNEGKLVAVGSVDEIFEKYHESVHRERMKSLPPEPAPIAAVESDADADADSGSGADADADSGSDPNNDVAPVELPVYDEQSIRNVGTADRRSRTSGDVLFTRLVAKNANDEICWEIPQGETVTFEMGFEVQAAVPNLTVLFRLYSDREAITTGSGNVVIEVCEDVSKESLPAGRTGTIRLALPTLRLMPRDFALYVCIGPIRGGGWFDVVDVNVALPSLTIRASRRGPKSEALVSLDYDLKCSVTDARLDSQANPAVNGAS